MLRTATTITELAMLAYWVLAGALVLKLISIDPALMYSDYENPLVIAWNWSFFPIDVAFAFAGLSARFGTFAEQTKFKLRTIGSVLMICAGVMAVSFWTITGDFNITWRGVNLWLIVLGMTNLLCDQMPQAETV